MISLGVSYWRSRSAGASSPAVASSPAPANAIYDIGYDDTRQITGGTPFMSIFGLAPYTVAVTTGSLPAGLSASVDMDGKLRINGVPSGAAGTSNFTLTVTDGLGATATFASSITVPQFPATLSINFGAKTRDGHGGHYCGNAQAAGTLAITAGNGAGHWQIIDNRLVPNGAGAFGTAGPAFSGPYTLTMSDGTNSQTLTINMVANRHDVAVGTATNPDTTSSFQLRTIMAGAILTRGDTIICRNGYYNPTAATYRVRPAVSYSGSGRIPIESEWRDLSISEANGLRNLKHGAKWGHLTFDSAVSGDVEMPFDLDYIWPVDSVVPSAGANLVRYVAEGYGVGAHYCRFETLSAPANYGTVFAFTLTAKNGSTPSCEDCLFVNVGQAITAIGTGFSIRRNYGIGMTADFIKLGVDSENYLIEDNFACNFQDAGDGAHRDFIQHAGNQTGADKPLGTIRRNACYQGVGSVGLQGIFFDDGIDPRRLTDGVVENNILIVTNANVLTLGRVTNPSVRFNTCLMALDFDAGASPTLAAVDGGTGGTITHNIAIAYNLASQTGATTTPNVTLAKNLGAYTAMFAGYAVPIVNLAQARARVTPVLNGPAKNGDGTYSGAVLPNGEWNAGAVYP